MLATMISPTFNPRWVWPALVIVALALAPAPAAEDSAKKSASPAVATPLPPPPLPVALYLTWQRDPVTTMTVHWHTDWTEGFTDSVLEYREAAGGNAGWQRAVGR